MLKFIIAGFGGIGVWHANHIRESGMAEVAGVCDISPDRREAARAQGFAAFDTMAALLASDADCAVVATLNDTHEALAAALLQSGKHVIVEKPAALGEASLRAMYAAADGAGRLLSVHQSRRWDVDFAAVKRVIDEGMLGRLTSLESRIHGSRGIPSDWRRSKAHGGGMLYDWGVHLIDQALLALNFQAPESVDCRFSHTFGGEVDDGFFLTLMFPGGLRAYIEMNTCNFIAMPRFYVCGRDGTAIIEDWQRPCRVTQCFAWREPDAESRVIKTMSPRDGATTRTTELERPAARSFEYLRNFCAAVEGREPLHVTREQALMVLRVVDAAFASAAAGRPVALTDG